MTIRNRNRLTLTFFFISLFFLFGDLGLFFYEIFNDTFIFPDVFHFSLEKTPYIFKYNSYCVIIALIVNLVYVCTTTLFIYRGFAKTQAPDISFFLLFLIACLVDTSRFFIPLFHISNTFSQFFIEIGNLNVFARILAPLALFGVTFLSREEYRLNVDRNCLILIVTALFFAYFIPSNTSVILPNFCISYGYKKFLQLFSFLICIINFITLFVVNRNKEYKQLMTIGFIFLSVGYSIMFYCYNIIGLIFGTIFLSLGSFIFLREIHNHYLWLN